MINDFKAWYWLDKATLMMGAFWLLRWLWEPGFPVVTDGEYHLARIANFYLALQEGQFPPRWAPTFLSGLGNPVFNYNYPFFNFLASLLLATGVKVTTALKLIISLSLVSAGLGMYQWMKLHVSKQMAWLGGVMYMASPYLQLDIYVRGNIGEVVCMGLIPWLFWIMEKMIVSGKWSWFGWGWCGLMACLLLSHNLTGVLVMVVMLFVMTLVFKPKRSWGWGLVLAGLMVAFFWIPALGEIEYVNISEASINNGYRDKFLSWYEVVTGVKVSDFNRHHSVRTQLGYGLVAGLGAGLVIGLRKKRIYQNRWVWSWMVVGVGSVFLSVWWSRWVWDSIAVLRYVQQPSRFLLFATLAGVVVTVWVIEELKSKWLTLIISGLMIVNVGGYSKPEQYIPYEDEFFYQFPLSSAAAEEFNPKWFDKDKSIDLVLDNRKVPYLIKGSDEVEVLIDFWNGSGRQFIIRAEKAVTVIEKTLIFPGWQTRIDGSDPIVDYDRTIYSGLINYRVPPGEHKVETRFTQHTPTRILGNGLSLVGWLVWLSWGVGIVWQNLWLEN